jgi:outer membrane murein-binding lipoprotein Lpp
MSRLRLLTYLGSAVLATTVLSGVNPAASAQIVSPAERNVLIQQNQLQMLENRLRRQQYQQQQQQYRAQDRQTPPPQQQVVPQMKPTCQLLPSGSGFVSTCR